MEKAKTFSEVISPVAKSFSEIAKKSSDIAKFNPYHGPDGRFTGPGAATSFTYRPGASTAHDRAIAREKERTAALAAAETPEKKRAAALKKVEDKIRKQNFESAALIDRDGNQLFFKDGESRSVTFTREESQMMRGATLTHNHPGSSSFSYEDMKTFVNRELQEIRAVGTNGNTYSLRRAQEVPRERPSFLSDTRDYEKENKFLDAFAKKFSNSVRKAQADLDSRGFREKIMSGEITQEFANNEMRKHISGSMTKYLSKYAKTYGFEFSMEGEL